MALPNECVCTGAPLPDGGGVLRVLRSAAGHYIGYVGEDELPWSRESLWYYPDAGAALYALEVAGWVDRSRTERPGSQPDLV